MCNLYNVFIWIYYIISQIFLIRHSQNFETILFIILFVVNHIRKNENVLTREQVHNLLQFKVIARVFQHLYSWKRKCDLKAKIISYLLYFFCCMFCFVWYITIKRILDTYLSNLKGVQSMNLSTSFLLEILIGLGVNVEALESMPMLAIYIT